MYAIVKVIITSLIIVAISELSKRSTFFGAVLASLCPGGTYFTFLPFALADNKDGILKIVTYGRRPVKC